MVTEARAALRGTCDQYARRAGARCVTKHFQKMAPDAVRASFSRSSSARCRHRARRLEPLCSIRFSLLSAFTMPHLWLRADGTQVARVLPDMKPV
jgi:hypothetical protein